MLSKKIGLDHILPRIRDSRISMRVDFNVPLKENEVKDVTRIKETIPSLKKIIEQ
jgi:phosphoglycerate kinase